MQLKDFVNLKLASADKEASAEGVPLTLENCKKYKKMRDLKVYGNCFQDGTPTPENPIEVQCVGEKSRNLLREDLFLASTQSGGATCDYEGNGIFHIYGDISAPETGRKYFSFATTKMNIPLTATHYTIYVRLVSGTPFYMTPFFYSTNGTETAQWANIGVYDTDTVGVTKAKTYPKTHNLTDANATDRFYIFSYLEAGESATIDMRIQIWLVEGSNTDVPYEPYGKYNIPIVCRGKNFFSMSKAKLAPKTINGITFTPLDDERIHITGKAIDTSVETNFRWDHADISIPPGQYVCKKAFNFNTFFGVRKKSDWVVNMNANLVTTVPDNASIYYTCIYIPKNTTREFDDIIEIMVEKGTALADKSSYEPYVEPITTNLYLDEPLRKVNTYADYIDGGNKKLHRLIHEYYIDGSQYIEPYSDRECFVHGNVRCKNEYATSASSHFPNWWYVGNTAPSFCMVNALGSRISIKNFKMIDGVTDTETLKQWFAKNPTTFIQPLETPIVEDLDIELPKLNAKTTIIEVDTSLAPSNITGKYIIR